MSCSRFRRCRAPFSRDRGGILFLTVVLQSCAFAVRSAPAPRPADSLLASRRLAQSLDDYWQGTLRRRPDLALALGVPVEVLPRHLPDDSKQDMQVALRVGSRLDNIDAGALTPSQYVLLQALRHELEVRAEANAFSSHDLSVMSAEDGTLRTALRVLHEGPLDSAADVERYLYHVDGLALWLLELRTGIEERWRDGVTAQRDVALAFGRRLQELRGPVLEDLLVPAPTRTAWMDEAIRGQFLTEVTESIRNRVRPALDTLVAFLDMPYGKVTRELAGLWQQPGGKEYYRALLRRHSGLDADPEQAHAVGLAQLRRADSLLSVVRSRNRWNPSPLALHDSLRLLQRLAPPLAAAVVTRVASELSRAALLLAGRFDSTLTPVPVVRWASRAEEFLHPEGLLRWPAAGDSAPEMVLTDAWRTRAAQMEMASRSFRRGVPGLLLQQSYTRNAAVDRFITLLGSPGSVAGWQEYAGALAGEMGLYADPLDAYAQLLHDAYVAALLVVDTGVHHFGWSKPQAMAVLSPRTLLTREELERVWVELIAASPGRGAAAALAGREMSALRAWMQRERGAAFTLQDWHGEVLRAGPVPLPILGRHLEWWAWEQRQRDAARRRAGSLARPR